ncbi:hypothetical protein [Nonlabens arenilitoris]|uniref:hypothetical protein n=1 Tax=Nonlabens arenilitoris TaxID=1217969 RepID=UPI00147315E2|nr:hypothetical protein [Nonlabens arenilitoris]
MGKLVVIQTVIPAYRIKVFDKISTELGDDFTLYGGQFFLTKRLLPPHNLNFINI